MRDFSPNENDDDLVVRQKELLFDLSFTIREGENAGWMIKKVTKPFEVLGVTSQSGSGSITGVFRIQGTDLGGGASDVTTTEATVAHNSNNVAAIGDVLSFQASANAAATFVTFTLHCKARAV